MSHIEPKTVKDVYHFLGDALLLTKVAIATETACQNCTLFNHLDAESNRHVISILIVNDMTKHERSFSQSLRRVHENYIQTEFGFNPWGREQVLLTEGHLSKELAPLTLAIEEALQEVGAMSEEVFIKTIRE